MAMPTEPPGHGAVGGSKEQKTCQGSVGDRHGASGTSQSPPYQEVPSSILSASLSPRASQHPTSRHQPSPSLCGAATTCWNLTRGSQGPGSRPCPGQCLPTAWGAELEPTTARLLPREAAVAPGGGGGHASRGPAVRHPSRHCGPAPMPQESRGPGHPGTVAGFPVAQHPQAPRRPQRRPPASRPQRPHTQASAKARPRTTGTGGSTRQG